MAETVTKTRLLKIGNSWGVRIPKRLLEQAGIEGAVELAVESGRIVIRPLKQAPKASGAFTRTQQREALRHWDDDEWDWE